MAVRLFESDAGYPVRGGQMAHWLLQGNPERWRLADFLAERGPEELTTWSVTRYRHEVQPGDHLALWRTGSDAGVIALGEVTGPVYEAAGAADEYWQDMDQAERTQWWLPLQLTEVFLDTPVPREELRHDPAFAQAAILRQPFAGNPFRLSDAEWTAIVARHRAEGPATEAVPTWSLQPGDRIRRLELHARYGGSWQDGVSPSARTPNILLFTDPRSGEQHGYYDLWAPDGSFQYTGRGQRGAQTLTSGNRAVLNHAKDGRALRLFQGARGIVEYVGEFVLDEQEPYSWAEAPSTGGGPLRRVVRFHLHRVDRPATASQSSRVGAPYQEQDETTEVSSLAPAAAPADPDAIGHGLRTHRRLQNQLSRLVQAAGHAPLRPSAIDPDFDLAWETPLATVVVEVKSCTKANEVRQLRMGIGQVLDYEDTLRARGRAVQPVLYLERAPSDARWVQLAERHNVRLVWPGSEHMLFEPTNSPSMQREHES
jgi:predicted RNA-binding protein with PUA-like domain